MNSKSELAGSVGRPDGTEITPVSPYPLEAEARPGVPGVYLGGTWEELAREADEAFGADLEKGDTLIGVPFVIVRATYRPGDYKRPDIKNANGDYVSLDVIIGPRSEIDKGIQRGRIIPPCTVEPGEHLVFNEAGTGVYRQVTEYLESKGRIRLDTDAPAEGRYGVSRYDFPVGSWQVDNYAKVTFADNGAKSLEFDIRLLCPRGLRASDYENEATKTGHTRYIA